MHNSSEPLCNLEIIKGMDLKRLRTFVAVAELGRHLEKTPPTPARDPIPEPPAFYAEPPYIGSHKFVGRRAQLETLATAPAAVTRSSSLGIGSLR